jgi:hypothetical protein
MNPENDSIKLTKHQAAAIQRNITDIEQYQQVIKEIQAKAEADRRMTDVIVLDGGFKPADYAQYALGEKDGEPHLILIRKPKPVEGI